MVVRAAAAVEASDRRLLAPASPIALRLIGAVVKNIEGTVGGLVARIVSPILYSRARCLSKGAPMSLAKWTLLIGWAVVVRSV
jgi:hypothetical protein